MELEKLRKRIDDIDGKIVDLVDERGRIAKKIGLEKKKSKIPMVDFNRIEEVIEGASRKSKVFPGHSMRSIYREIISASTSLQKEEKIGYLGPAGSFCHIAALKFFGSSLPLIPFMSVEEIFDSVQKGDLDFGSVPIENSTEGSLNATLDLLVEKDVFIVGEIILKVQQNLLAKPETRLEDIETVYSHPQALAQCKEFLKQRKWMRREAASTSYACTILDGKSAAIASELAADIYKLKILKRNIQDDDRNATRFVLISKENLDMGKKGKTKRMKTSIAFSLLDKPGALYGALDVFAKKKINLTKIESRPAGKWEYLFYLDYEGFDEGAMRKIEEKSKFFKNLGTYPKDSG